MMTVEAAEQAPDKRKTDEEKPDSELKTAFRAYYIGKGKISQEAEKLAETAARGRGSVPL